MTIDIAKRAAAKKALELVEPEMTIGLGTGSTAAYFVDLLGEKVRAGLSVKGIPTSQATREQALANGITLIEPDETTRIDLAVDGADEIDGSLNLIKGGGGALLREKIIAQSATKFTIIADRMKLVKTLGTFALPIEIDTFGWALTIQQIRLVLANHHLSITGLKLRPGPTGMFQSDGGHFIVDCALGRIEKPADLDHHLRTLPGVMETGLFTGMTEKAYIGFEDGHVEEITS